MKYFKMIIILVCGLGITLCTIGAENLGVRKRVRKDKHLDGSDDANRKEGDKKFRAVLTRRKEEPTHKLEIYGDESRIFPDIYTFSVVNKEGARRLRDNDSRYVQRKIGMTSAAMLAWMGYCWYGVSCPCSCGCCACCLSMAANYTIASARRYRSQTLHFITSSAFSDFISCRIINGNVEAGRTVTRAPSAEEAAVGLLNIQEHLLYADGWENCQSCEETFLSTGPFFTKNQMKDFLFGKVSAPLREEMK